MQNFFLDQCRDAYGCMAEILGEPFEQAQMEVRLAIINLLCPLIVLIY